MNEFKGAFEGCNWCHGNGCMMCDRQREAAIQAAMEPIFVADRNDPADLEALARIAHADVLEKDFAPGGDGIHGVNERAAIETIRQLLRKGRTA